MQRLLVIDRAGPLAPHGRLIDPQVVVAEGQAGELDQPRMHEEVVQRSAPRLRKAPHPVELRRTEPAAFGCAVTKA